jgi:hypothetical protein
LAEIGDVGSEIAVLEMYWKESFGRLCSVRTGNRENLSLLTKVKHPVYLHFSTNASLLVVLAPFTARLGTTSTVAVRLVGTVYRIWTA